MGRFRDGTWDHSKCLKKGLTIQNRGDVIPESVRQVITSWARKGRGKGQIWSPVKTQSEAAESRSWWPQAWHSCRSAHPFGEVGAVGMWCLVGWESSWCSPRTRSPPALPFQLAHSSQSLSFGLGSTFPWNRTIWWSQSLDLYSGALWGLF